MDKSDKIRLIEEYVKSSIKGYDSGHDWWHTDRVRRLALYINEKENSCDPFEIELVALLHDIADSKFSGENRNSRMEDMIRFLSENDMGEFTDRVTEVISNISFSSRGKSGFTPTAVLKIVQDADMIDAIGAIGIARAFNYGGFRNNPIYDPSGEAKSTIGHFHEKLLKLKGLMNTETGKILAEQRHNFIELFLGQFKKEWNGTW